MGGERGIMEEKVQELRSIIGRYKIYRDVKNSMGNGGDKELVCTTHGHELSGGITGGMVVQGGGGQ